MVRKIFFAVLFPFLLLLWQGALAAAPVVIIADGEYVVGGGETMEVGEAKAHNLAKQKAAQQAGAFVKSHTKVKNMALESDSIEVIAHHAMKIEVIEKKRSVLGDVEGIKFYVKIKATLSPEEIEANLKKVMHDEGIVAQHNRLKAEFERQNREMEKLKRQLDLATGGDRQKITRLISAEEKKYKATLWLERAQQIWNDEEKRKAYSKALELNPDLPQAYFGLAKTMVRVDPTPTDESEKEKRRAILEKARENLQKALLLDEDYGEAYALRAQILYKIKWLENQEEKEKDYHDEIRRDINRALALNAPNKGELYYLRAYLYLDELQSAELTQARNDSFDGRVIEDYLQKALDEIDRAGRLCPEGDGRCRGEYLRGKANAFNLVVNYYLRRNDTAKAAEYERLRNKAHTHAETLEKQERSEFGKEEDNLIIQLHNTEYGKIGYELERGWKDKVIRGVTGLSVPEILAIEKNDKEKSEKIWKQTLSEIKGKIANGSASAEEYLVLSQMEDNTQERKAYFDQGIALFEKRNPQGIEALLLVNIYWDRTIMESEDVRLLYLNKAQKIIDKNLPAAQRAVGVDEFKALFHELEKESKAPQNIVPKLARYDRKQAEALHWFQMAMTVSQLKAEIYERLDLPRKAREAYLYLCETLKSDEACRNAERLKK